MLGRIGGETSLLCSQDPTRQGHSSQDRFDADKAGGEVRKGRRITPPRGTGQLRRILMVRLS